MINLDKLEYVKSEADQAYDAAYSDSVTYLQSTDWQVIAMIERSRPVPDDVQEKRRKALDVVTYE